MLVDLTFDIEKVNARFADRGVTFGIQKVNGGEIFQYTIDHSHEFWKKHKGIDTGRPCNIVGHETLGIYWGNSLDHAIRDYFEDDVLDAFSTFDLEKGTLVSRAEYSKIWDLPDEDKTEHLRLMSHNVASYGVADNVQQVLERFQSLIANPDVKVLFGFNEVHREDCSEQGGWRWHKNGEYIGKKNPQHEYLYDDTHIDSVVMYHVYCLK